MSPPEIPPGGQFLVYQTDDGQLKIDVRFEGETVWLTQHHMTTLFQTSKQNVSLHIQNIFSERELREDSVVKESLTTAADGKNYATKFYNLDVIISVGYRVKSLRGTQFRIWAAPLLREYKTNLFGEDTFHCWSLDQRGFKKIFLKFLATVFDLEQLFANRTRQGYARKRILKPAGHFFYPPNPDWKLQRLWQETSS